MQGVLARPAKVYLAVVFIGGAAAAVYFLATLGLAAVHVQPFAVFTILAVAASTVTISYQSRMPTKMTYQVSTAFLYALFLLAHPGLVCIAAALYILADKWVNRRGWLTTAFNIAQHMIAISAAVGVRALIDTSDPASNSTQPALVASLVSVFVFATANHLMTTIIVMLVNQRRLATLSTVLQVGLLFEVMLVFSGVGMATLWRFSPWLTVLGLVPLTITVWLVRTLGIREQTLEAREDELKSLQGLGLELGAELNEERLQQSVLRLAGEAVGALGGFLGRRREDGGWIELFAYEGLAPEPPGALSMAGLDEAFFRADRTRIIADFKTAMVDYAGCGLFYPRGLLLTPLEVNGKRNVILALIHREERRRFDEGDARRVDSLVPFINVALSNAQLVVRLREMQDQLAQTEKMSALGMLVSGVAHELNNPLTSVLGYTELLQSGEAEPQRRAMFDRVLKETRRAGKIVNNLLTFSRKKKPAKKRIELNRVLEDVLEFRRYEQQVHNIAMSQALAPNLPPVFADPDQLQQVFLNLVTNAEHAILITGRPGQIHVSTRYDGANVRVRFVDDGVGIHPDHLGRVFLPFFTTKEVGQGTGLGLSICYGIIKEHGGQIEVSRRTQGGTVFEIEIPAAGSRELPTKKIDPEALPVMPAGYLLVVEDEAPIADLVTCHFEWKGWTVSSASDGRQALALLDQGQRIDVLVVDLCMPGLDGFAFYDVVTERHPHLKRRIVFITGDTGNKHSFERLERTGRQVIIKPFDLEELDRAVRQIQTRDLGSTTVDPQLPHTVRHRKMQGR